MFTRLALLVCLVEANTIETLLYEHDPCERPPPPKSAISSASATVQEVVFHGSYRKRLRTKTEKIQTFTLDPDTYVLHYYGDRGCLTVNNIAGVHWEIYPFNVEESAFRNTPTVRLFSPESQCFLGAATDGTTFTTSCVDERFAQVFTTYQSQAKGKKRVYFQAVGSRYWLSSDGKYHNGDGPDVAFDLRPLIQWCC